jgi:cellulose synthase/poly-beta-1,6-N-acetylglucosamine synthase-like glycosyltransferase
MALILFWLSAGLLLYTYIGFLLVLAIRSIVFPKPYQSDDARQYSVSMIICAYNEALKIKDKIENILILDYPAELFEAVIVSDGSDDGTNAIIAEYAGDRIKFLSLPRVGKEVALNHAVTESKGEILVFSDANSIYAVDALRNLVRPFADPAIGGVAGNQRYLTSKTGMNEGERRYWAFDRVWKTFESRSGNVISATGAIYAIRRSLFQKVPSGIADDFVISVRVIAQGYRLIFVQDAEAFEAAAETDQDEFRRKVRVITRGLHGVLLMRELLNPFRYGFYAIQLFTHKVLRRLMYIPLIVLFLMNLFLINQGWFYQLIMLAQLTFVSTALIAWFLAKRQIHLHKFFALPMHFCMVYFAAMLATWNVLRGHQIAIWSPDRAVAD